MSSIVKLVLTYILVFSISSLNGQVDSTISKRDTIIITQNQSDVNFKLFPTDNVWTFLKLDTRTGQITQVQYSVSGENKFETYLNMWSLVSPEDQISGRFNLFPTQNIWNFILLDQIDGRVWQAQWSQEPENRGILRIK